jgi:predicted ATP-binding protein involved in virulence
MFLKEIELIDFKCHEHLKLSFSTGDKKKPVRKTTFMLGENGTGKSALLKAIALITAGSSALGDVLGNPDDWIKKGKTFTEISAIITTAEGEERRLLLKIKKGHNLREIIEENRDTLILVDNAIAKAERSYFVVAYGASRRLSRDENGFSNKKSYSRTFRSANILSLFNPDAALISLAGWAMELDYSSSGAGISAVKNSLNKFLVENVKFKRIDKKKKQLIFSTPDGEVPLEQLSDGYQNVAAWVGDLMFNITNTFKDYKDPLKARGLLLIDEIDLHLHPKWQRLLHAFIKTRLPNFQIVASTHSPLTAQQAEEFELYALKRENKKIALVPFRGNPSKLLVHQLLMTPVFGLSTDESLITEKKKGEYDRLKSKKSHSSTEKTKLTNLAIEVKELTPDRYSTTKQKREIALLEKLETTLSK